MMKFRQRMILFDFFVKNAENTANPKSRGEPACSPIAGGFLEKRDFHNRRRA